jgi:hypothetical protein
LLQAGAIACEAIYPVDAMNADRDGRSLEQARWLKHYTALKSIT